MKRLQKSKAIWLFAGGAMQEIAAKKIVARGYKLILTDTNRKCVCASLSDEFIELDTFDIENNIKEARRLSRKYDIKAVLTSGADCHESVASVAKFLGVHGVDPKISKICRYKLETRRLFEKAGIPGPAFREASTFKEAHKAVKEIGLPVVIKASDSSGSRGFSKIERSDDLTEEVFSNAFDNGTTGYVIIEELMIPVENEIAEQSVETIWYNGKMYWLNWVDRLFREDLLLFDSFKKFSKDKDFSWGVELAHINPAVHDVAVKEEIKSMIYRAGKAIGLDKQKGGHIFKADTMITTKGPRIIEITLRLSGGWDSSLTTPNRGGDFIGGMISLALGEELDLDLWYRCFEYRNPSLYSSVFALVKKNARDCIGRKFSVGDNFNREISLKNAYQNVVNKRFINFK